MTEKEISIIKQCEENWKEKEKIVKTLIQLGNNPDDKLIIDNSAYIVNGIENLKQKIEDYRVSVINDFDFSMKISVIKESSNSTNQSEETNANTIGNMNKYQLQNSRFVQKMIKTNKITKKTEIEKVNVTLEQLLDSITEMFSFKEPNTIELKA